MNLNQKQIETKEKIEKYVKAINEIFGINLDPIYILAMAMTESSLGIEQKSPTGARGVFQMTSIAMKDLLQEMEKSDNDLVDISGGVDFLYILLRRHKTIEEATAHYCDPADRDFYIERVKEYMKNI